MNLLSFIPDGEQFKIDPNNKISSKIQNIHNNVQYRLQLKRFINPINNRTFATDFRILEKKEEFWHQISIHSTLSNNPYRAFQTLVRTNSFVANF